MPSLEEAYWKRQPVLLEACGLLQQGVADSLGDQSDCTCDFRIIELRDLLTLVKNAEAGFDVWRDSASLILGTVTAPGRERLEEARIVTAKLFTVHEEQESAAIYLVPPWAKPAAWSESLALPTHLKIRFLVYSAPAPREEAESLSLFQPLTLALSGGGMRAAVFQLGILVFLAHVNRLKDVREIVSVSGGTILAAHFLKHWSKALGRASDFREVAAEFLQICRSDIRDRIFVPWVWSRLLPWCWFLRSKGRTGRLRAEYQRIYGATTLGDLNDSGPNLAFVATDGRHHQRVAFTASQILRWSFDIEPNFPPEPILSQGVELSLAVAASSCFPPVFPRLHLNHTDLGITYREFMQKLYLNDGGVVTNLGIEVLIALRTLDWTKGKLILIADAERNVAVMPGDSSLTDVDATLAALGKAAREAAKREFGTSAIPIPFADRVQNKDGLPFRVETAMFNYRTDLDSPTWQEIHGLMIHGAMVARQATQAQFEPLVAEHLKQTIATIIAEAGGPADLSMPTEADFRHCGTRPLWKVRIHAALVIFLMVSLASLFVYAVVSVVSSLSIRDMPQATVAPIVSSDYKVPPLPATTVSYQPLSISEVPLLPDLNYKAFEFLSAELLVDMRRWEPFGNEDVGIRKSAVIATKRFVGRKLQPIDEIRMYGATEGLAIDAECISQQPFRIEYASTTGKPRVNLMKEYHVIVDLSAVPTSSRFEVVTRMITWNGMKEHGNRILFCCTISSGLKKARCLERFLRGTLTPGGFGHVESPGCSFYTV